MATSLLILTHGAGYHHRHEWTDGEEQVTGIEFTDLERHLARFRIEVSEYDHQALADALDRNYADVHGDVQVLAEHHIVYFDTDGRAKRPVIPYDRVRVDIEVTGGPAGERAPV
ncbi:hypothetical protein [Haloarcula montana]|uniref:HVO_A0114 family putative DNA-binding protein n=1 Tax=Haloarcula montana TaxID=3111776 RepID=UPI002D7A262A|nr:hypothetical protein [Haloarcula sp. GH36]